MTTNLLEDETDELRVTREETGSSSSASILLDFHAFEVKTVKIEIASIRRWDEDRWVPVSELQQRYSHYIDSSAETGKRDSWTIVDDA